MNTFIHKLPFLVVVSNCFLLFMPCKYFW